MAAHKKRPLSLAGLRGFEAAARHLSFTLAAKELHLTQSSVSRQVQSLEDELGKPLFVRKTRALELTVFGQKLYRATRSALGEIDRSVNEIRGTAQRKRVSVTTWASFASLWLVPRLPAFAHQNPDIDIRIEATDEVLDIEAESIDIAIRYCREEQAPRHAVKLMDEELTPALSPALLARIGPIKNPADIAKCTLLVLDDGSQSAEENSWENWLRLAGLRGMQPTSRLLFNFIDQSMQAAVRGQGVVLAKTPFLRDFIEHGDLITPFDIRLPSRYGYYLIACSAVPHSEHKQAFRDWIVSQAA